MGVPSGDPGPLAHLRAADPPYLADDQFCKAGIGIGGDRHRHVCFRIMYFAMSAVSHLLANGHCQALPNELVRHVAVAALLAL